MANLPPGAGIDPGGTLDSAYPEGVYEPPSDLSPADLSAGNRSTGNSQAADRSLLTDVLAALVVVGLPVVVFVVLGTPRLELPAQWPDAKALVDDGPLPGGLTLNLIFLVLVLAWVGALALFAASVADRVQGHEPRPSEPRTQPPPDEEDPRQGRKTRKRKKQAEDDSEEPWYRQGAPLFAEPIVDMERIEPPSGAEPSGAEPAGVPSGAEPSGAEPSGAGMPGGVPSGAVPSGPAETYGGFSLSAPSPGAAPPTPPMGSGPIPPGADYPMPSMARETGVAPMGEPPEVVPIRAYYVARSADTLRSVAAQFLNSPGRWEEVRSLNAAYPGIAGLGPDDLIAEGSALMLPGDPMPWGKPDPVYLWTLAERFLFTAWGREPSPSEVVPFWKGLALGMEIDEDALGDLGEIPGAAAALTTPGGPSPEGPGPTHQPPTSGIPMPQAPAAEPTTAYGAEPAVEPPTAQPAYEPTGAPAPAYDPAAAEPAAHAPAPTAEPADHAVLPTVESSSAADPAAAEPSDQQPSPYEPAAYQPPADEPPTYQPPTAEPPIYQPPAAYEPPVQPPAAEPPTYQPPTVEPPTYQPPVDEPPTYQPPTAEPPIYQPPAAYEPPVQPPTAEPPTYQPPTAEPPTAYEPPVQPPEAEPPSYAPPDPYAEQEAPPLPQFMPSVTGPDASAQPAGEVGVTQRSLAGTAIGDAMLLWRLSRLRQRRSGAPGRGQIPDPLVESLERNARMDSLRLIEAAMRQLRAVTVAQLKEKPKVMAVRVGAYGFEVLLDEPAAPPEGWRAASGGYVLELDEGTTLEQLDAVGHGMSLCPALVPVGDTAEGPLLLNIEEIGCLMVSGSNIASANLVSSIAEALGSSPMASDVRVVTVGVNAPVGPGWERILATSFDSPQLEQLLVAAAAPEPASPGLDVLVVGPGHDILIQRAGQIAFSPRSNLALVGATSSTAARWPWRIHVDDTARAVVQPIACTMMAARAMSPELAASLSAEASDQFNPPPGF